MTHFHTAWTNIYLVALRSIPIHYRGKGQKDTRVCPRTAHFQRMGSIVQQHIQCLLVHYYLRKQWKQTIRLAKHISGDSQICSARFTVTFSWLSRWCTSWHSLMTKCSWLNGTRQLACFSREHTSWNENVKVCLSEYFLKLPVNEQSQSKSSRKLVCCLISIIFYGLWQCNLYALCL